MTRIVRYTSLFAIVFLAAGAAEIALGISWTPFEQSLGYFLAATIGLNSAHVGMTYAVLLLPESEHYRRPGITLGGFAFLLLLFGACLWINRIEDRSLNPEFLAFPLYQSLLVFHALMQSKGVLLLTLKGGYSRRALEFGFWTLLGLSVAVTASEGGLYELAREWKLWILAGELAILIGIFTLGLRSSPESKCDFLIFMPRLLLWPLAIFSFTALIGTLVLHGIEYAMVSGKLMHSSEAGFEKRRRIRALGWAFAAICCVLSLGIPSWTFGPGLVIATTAEKPLILRWFMATLMFVTLVHILIDSSLFRFRNHEAAARLRPLLQAG